MYTSAILDLRLQPNWEPGHLTAEAFRWPTAAPTFPIRDLATRLGARSFTEAGSPVVTPGDVDHATGGVRRRSKKYQGSVYQVGAELRSGDVLLPRVGLGPAILISARLKGALLSARFAAVRPVEADLGLWLWAVLSSESGRRMRANFAHGAPVEPPSLLEATVPVPALEHRRDVAGELREIHASTSIVEDEPVETWWTVTDLRTSEWRIALATPDPSILNDGEPLGHFCGEIVRGRLTRSLAVDEEMSGYVPVANVSYLGGKPPRRWVPESEGNPRLAHPGDLLVAGLGNLSYARVADEIVAVDSHVLLLRLRNPSNGAALARYLNGQDAFQIRQLLASGSTIPQLSASDVARIPVPESALEMTTAPIAPVSLAQRLEQVLWRH